MKRPGMTAKHSLAAVMAGLWMLLIVYASLYPFTGWRVPPGAGLIDLLRLPWGRWLSGFDPVSNLLGYLPLGLLLAFVSLRQQGSRLRAIMTAALGAALLSFATELAQQFVPRRVPSAQDWAMNVTGAGLGACLAVLVDAFGWSRQWRWTHDRWLAHGGRGALTLLLLWPVGLLFPSPLPFGLGQVGARLRDGAVAALDDVSWAQPVLAWLDASEVFEPAGIGIEAAVAVLGLLAPCLLAYAASSPSWRRIWLGLGMPCLAAAAVTLSTALNYGPEHAFAWHTSTVTAAMGMAMLLALALTWVGPRLAAALALIVLTALVVLVHMAPADPYFAQSLQAWELGRFVRFHGIAQWVGWLWPYAAMAWLLARLGQRGAQPL